MIEHVYPTVDRGRHPVKRMVGDVCHVGADIYGAGHDLLAGCVRYRNDAARSWRSVPLRYDYDSDRWHGEFVLDRIGRWRFRIESWIDEFGTWSDWLRKKLDAGQDISLELLEGAELIRRGMPHAPATARKGLASAAALLADTQATLRSRTKLALSQELERLMGGVVDPRDITQSDREYPVVVDRERARFAAWYEMFPRSQGTEPGKPSTFAQAERRLPRLAELGFDVIYLPPIHPIGHTHRKGSNNALVARPGDPGSPWAIGSEAGGHTAIAPELGTLTDFEHFVRTAESLGLEVALDYALQCSPDHPWVAEHPDWFMIRPDGSIRYAENPPKKYEDIYPLDFWCKDRENLWRASKEIIEFWVDHGVKTFRVDNPHTKPLAFWEWMISDVKNRHPDVVFLAEAFTRPKRMWGIAKLGFTQSYTHFTWKNSSHELRELMTQLHKTELVEYFRGNLFVNTPDILHEYLQRGGRPAFRVRLLLAATLSPLYGVYSGFELCENEPREQGSEEYMNSEKYEVRVRNWEAPGNINDDIQRLNHIRRDNPALQSQGNLEFSDTDNEQLLCYSRTRWGNDLLIVANLDPHHAQAGSVRIPLGRLGLNDNEPYHVEDLLTGERYTWRGEANYVHLDPQHRVGHVLRIVR
ncbi:MAG: alpha-1,4-glucan--maltose-1-phosphate maltosyltransferase [Gemmatimonadota bacterium]|nr:MAG: alpha-1,4-glucan--maltose-1-phosphate maltosyltransferase [Gemmatimonadota bacterium]